MYYTRINVDFFKKYIILYEFWIQCKMAIFRINDNPLIYYFLKLYILKRKKKIWALFFVKSFL